MSAWMRSSGMYAARISNSTWWSMEAKNLRMSHLSAQQVRVWFLDTWYANCRKLFIARCVPFPFRHEYESAMNVRSKNG